MTKRAVWQTYQEFLGGITDEMLTIVAGEFGGGLLGKAAKTGAKRVTKNIQDEMRQQGRLVVEYGAVLVDDDSVSGYEDRLLWTNPVYERYDGAREAELRNQLVTHFRQVGSDLAPLVAAPTDDVWAEMFGRDANTMAPSGIVTANNKNGSRQSISARGPPRTG
jgi:hypothetical protein